MKEVTILLLHMQHGGIEKQSITFANELVKKYKVNIVCVYSMNAEPAYKLDSRVNVTYLIKGAPNKAEFKKAIKQKNPIKILREGIKAMQILRFKKALMVKAIKGINNGYILSTRCEFADLLSKYANENTVTITQEHLNNDTPKYIKKVQKAFANLDYLVVLGPGSKENYSNWLQDNKKIKIVEIPNILENIPTKKASLKNKNIVAVGRLHPEKGFDDLIKVFKEVSKKVEDATLTLVGDGEEKNNLKELVNKLELQDKVTFTGMVSAEEVKKYMLESSVYAMTSLSECLPMVLLEASALGIPLVAFDVPVGPRAIIKHNENGYLIQNRDIDEMARRLIFLLENEAERVKLGNTASLYAEKYLAENVMPLWDGIFLKRM